MKITRNLDCFHHRKHRETIDIKNLSLSAVPGTAQAVWERIGMDGLVTDQRLPDAAGWGGLPTGRPVTKGEPLFPRLATS